MGGVSLVVSSENVLICSRCGYKLGDDARMCVLCGSKSLSALPHRRPSRPAAAVSLHDDTVELPAVVPVGLEERVVRPSLAVLFRLAVGPAADYYTPRFLRYEGAGHGAPGWLWPALVL